MNDLTKEVMTKINNAKVCKETAYHSIGSTLKSDGDYEAGRWWGQYTWPHNIIEEEFLRYYGSLGNMVYAEYSIPTSSPMGNQGFADMVNKTTGEIYEIKVSSAAARGVAEVNNYVISGNRWCPPPTGTWKPGVNWYGLGMGRAYAKEVFCYPCGENKKIKYWLEQPGVVLYQLVDNESPALDPVNVPSFFPAPYKDAMSERVKRIVVSVKDLPAYLWGPAASTLLMNEVGRIVEQNLRGLTRDELRALAIVGSISVVAAVTYAVFSGGLAVPVAAVQLTICAAIITVAAQQLEQQ